MIKKNNNLSLKEVFALKTEDKAFCAIHESEPCTCKEADANKDKDDKKDDDDKMLFDMQTENVKPGSSSAPGTTGGLSKEGKDKKASLTGHGGPDIAKWDMENASNKEKSELNKEWEDFDDKDRQQGQEKTFRKNHLVKEDFDPATSPSLGTAESEASFERHNQERKSFKVTLRGIEWDTETDEGHQDPKKLGLPKNETVTVDDVYSEDDALTAALDQVSDLRGWLIYGTRRVDIKEIPTTTTTTTKKHQESEEGVNEEMSNTTNEGPNRQGTGARVKMPRAKMPGGGPEYEEDPAMESGMDISFDDDASDVSSSQEDGEEGIEDFPLEGDKGEEVYPGDEESEAEALKDFDLEDENEIPADWFEDETFVKDLQRHKDYEDGNNRIRDIGGFVDPDDLPW
jgi:hypothetical protein